MMKGEGGEAEEGDMGAAETGEAGRSGTWERGDRDDLFGEGNVERRSRDPFASGEERTYAKFAHVVPGLVLVFGGFGVSIVAALVMWLTKRNESPFVDDHGREVANFHITLGLYALASVPLFFACGLGWLVLVATWVLAVVGTVNASRSAQAGEFYRYPMCVRLIG